MTYQLGWDLPGIFMMAQRAKSMQQQRRIGALQEQGLLRENQIQSLLPRARQAALSGGDFSLLDQIAPQESMQMRQGIADVEQERQRQALAAQEAQQQTIEDQNMSLAINMPRAVEDPSKYQMVRNKVRLETGYVLPEQMDPRMMKVIADDATAAISGVGGVKPSGSAIEAAERISGQPGMNPALIAAQDPNLFRKEVKKVREGKGRDISISITQPGKQQLTAKNRSQAQSDIKTNTSNINTINALLKKSEGLFGTLGADVKTGIGRLSEYVGLGTMTQKEFLDKRQDLMTDAVLFGSNFLKGISGAAVSDVERARLEKAIANPNTMTPTQFKSALRSMKKIAERAIGLDRKLLGEGVDIGTGSGIKSSRRRELEGLSDEELKKHLRALSGQIGG
jgi:hypothetical protein